MERFFVIALTILIGIGIYIGCVVGDDSLLSESKDAQTSTMNYIVERV